MAKNLNMKDLEKKIQRLLTRNVLEIIDYEHLKKALLSGERLRVKLGVDPTAPDIHLGIAVTLRKLKEFQDLGHQVIFIIGDFTARIGDPTGRSITRPPLSKEQVEKNAATYFQQVGKILDVKKAEIYFNSEWYSKWSAEDLLLLQAKFTVPRILERDDFQERLKDSEAELHCHEIVYPMLQAFDSVQIKASLEIGGSDQKFNMLAGRRLQRKMNLPEQDIMTLPLLVGLDGQKKMSKSLGNYVGINEEPFVMYGKIMSLSDNLISTYFRLCTDFEEEEIQAIEEQIKKGANPRDFKMQLAREIVKIYWGEKESFLAEEKFKLIFQEKKIPEDIPSFSLSKEKINIVDLLCQTKLASSKSEARRLIAQKGIKIDGQVIEDPDFLVELNLKEKILQKGKRFFIKIKK